MPQIVSIILAIGLVFVIASAHYTFTQFWKLGDVKQVLSETKNNLLGPPDSPNTNIGQWIEPIIKNPDSLIVATASRAKFPGYDRPPEEQSSLIQRA